MRRNFRLSFIAVFLAFIYIFYFSDSNKQLEAVYKNIKQSNDVQIIIDINEKRLYVIISKKITASYPIASGRPNAPSPLGDFTIIQKARWGEGFGSAWLGLDVPWGRYGIHGTNRPESIGYSVSGGCIRMRNEDINKLYKIVDIGTPVKIIGGIYGMLGNGYRVLCPGDRGSDVYIVQNKLKKLGFYKGNLDGIYGISMEKALNEFEKSKGLPITNKINDKIYKELGIILFE